MPTIQPISSAQPLKNRVNRPSITAGSVWMIHTPPSNCIWIAYWNGMKKMNTSAPILITSDTILATWLSSASVQVGFTNSR